MKVADHRLRFVLPDAGRLERVLRLLAEGGNRKVLVLLNEQPADAGTLARRMREALESVRNRLSRLARGGLVAAGRTGRHRVYRLGKAVTVSRRGRGLAVVVATPGGSKMTLRMPDGLRPRARK